MHSLFIILEKEKYWVYFTDKFVIQEVTCELEKKNKILSYRRGEFSPSHEFIYHARIEIRKYLENLYADTAKRLLMHN